MKKSKIDGARVHRIDALAASLCRRGFLQGCSGGKSCTAVCIPIAVEGSDISLANSCRQQVLLLYCNKLIWDRSQLLLHDEVGWSLLCTLIIFKINMTMRALGAGIEPSSPGCTCSFVHRCLVKIHFITQVWKYNILCKIIYPLLGTGTVIVNLDVFYWKFSLRAGTVIHCSDF